MAKEVRGTPDDGATAGLQPPAGDGGVGAPGTPAANGPSGGGASAAAASEAGAPAEAQEALAAQSAEDQQRYNVLRPQYDRVSSEKDELQKKLTEVEAKVTLLDEIETQFGGAQALLDDSKTRQAEQAAQPAAPGPAPVAEPIWPNPQAAQPPYGQPLQDPFGPEARVEYLNQLAVTNPVQAQQLAMDWGIVRAAQAQPQGQQFDQQKFGEQIVERTLATLDQREHVADKFASKLRGQVKIVRATYGRDWLDQTIVAPDIPEMGLDAGQELERGEAAEIYCESTGRMDMEAALLAVDRQGVFDVEVNQRVEEAVAERLREGQGAMPLTPGAVVGGPQPVSVDAEMGQQIETEGEFAVGEPPEIDL